MRTTVLYLYYGDESDNCSKDRIMIGRVNEIDGRLLFIKFILSEEEENIIDSLFGRKNHDTHIDGIINICSSGISLEELIKPYVNSYRFGEITNVLRLADRWRIDSYERKENMSKIVLKWFCKKKDIENSKKFFKTKYVTIDAIGKKRMLQTKKRGKLI